MPGVWSTKAFDPSLIAASFCLVACLKLTIHVCRRIMLFCLFSFDKLLGMLLQVLPQQGFVCTCQLCHYRSTSEQFERRLQSTEETATNTRSLW